MTRFIAALTASTMLASVPAFGLQDEASGDEDVDGLHRAMQRSAGNGRRKSRAKPAAEESSEKGESADSAESSDSDKPAEGGSESAPQ